ncbi:hypothetical protein [Novosphingobium sp. AP12]|uniref:hypothetical protein n=1 Tax=Novosphingobium sp. AP12 TaxID=1144305 RepID=UPI00027223E6|nr:hypothetical protein [Novosphingobium sp. AP12]EJL29631.1 hypothetical protein PMI02_02168 [Novosphingobium sp. AP12]
MARKFLVSRVALAVALSSGLALGVASPAMAAKKEKAPASNFSPEFVKVAGPIEKAMTEATAKVPANAQPTDLAAAKQAFDAAVGGNGKTALEGAAAAATTPDDKMAAANWMRNYGIISQDRAFTQRGNVMLLESGKLPAASVGSTNYSAGITAYQLSDYANSAKYLKAAKDAGYVDSSGQLDLVLADAYKKSNNPDAALQMAKDDVAAAQAKGVAPSETALRSVLQQTYSAKQLAPSTEYAALLGQYYPGTWGTAISVVAQLAALPRDQDLDLIRLKYATGTMTEKRDYYEYIDAVDPRAFPGEAAKVMTDGIAKGKLTKAEIGADLANAQGRVAADKASLPSVERDASKPGATAASVVGAGDLFLSYDQPAKAETFYAKALSMPGVDANKVALRLGMSQALTGKYADAQTNLAKVTGTRVPVAKLWSAYAKGKASPAAAAPAAPAAN